MTKTYNLITTISYIVIVLVGTMMISLRFVDPILTEVEFFLKYWVALGLGCTSVILCAMALRVER